MRTMRLKENHPAMVAFEELCSKAADLGISICFEGGKATVTVEGKEYNLRDVDQEDYLMDIFPPMLEFKLTYEKE